MMHHLDTSLTERHTAGLLICHGFVTMYCQISKHIIISSQILTISPAREANIATHAWTKLYTDELNFWCLCRPVARIYRQGVTCVSDVDGYMDKHARVGGSGGMLPQEILML